MTRFSKMWYWIVVAAVLILAAGITTLFAQTNEAPVTEETKPHDNANEVEPVPKVEPQQENPAVGSSIVNLDPSIRIEYQQLFNDLRKEYLDTRAASVEWWLTFVTIIIGLLALFLALLGFLGLQEFKRLKAEAKTDADEIKKHLTEVLDSMAKFERVKAEAESNEIGTKSSDAIQNTRETLSAEVFATLSSDEEFEKGLRDFEQIPNLSFIDKAMVEAYKLQKDGKITEAIQKWRSIANIVDEVDKNLAARAWSSVGYLFSEQEQAEDAISAYDKAIEMKSDYADAYYNRGRQRVKSGQYLDGMDDLDKAINLNFDEAKVYVVRGIARFELGKHDDAFTDYDRAIYMKPDYPNAHAIRGEAKAKSNDIPGAKVDFQNALGLAKEQGEKELIEAIEKSLQELNEVE